jgi:DNA helicase-2/ATP-dependent DNA helicase PcrA
MYVAITRARQRLYMSHSQTRMLHGQTRFNLKSRFFDELPEEALKWLTPKHVAPVAGGFAGAGRGWQSNLGSQGFSAERYAGAGSVRVEKEVARKDDSVNGLKVKQKVFHAKFGEGTVLTLEGVGDDARAQINFPRHGTKWLALSVAKLTPVP